MNLNQKALQDEGPRNITLVIGASAHEQILPRKEQLNRLENAVLRLPPEYQEILVLSAFEQMNNQQIASHCGLPMTMVKQYLGMAFKMIEREVELY